MSIAIVCEDQPKAEARITDLVKDCVDQTAGVTYRQSSGGIRSVSDVARDASERVNDRTIFIIDLVPAPDLMEPSYGLRVIKGIARCLRGEVAMPAFLSDPNWFVVVVTSFPKRTQQELAETWSIAPNDVEIRHIRTVEDIDYVVRNHDSTAILPIIEKNTREGLLRQLAQRWSSLQPA